MTQNNHGQVTEPESVDTGTAALMLGVHPNTLRRWDAAGKLRAWRTPGGFRRFAVEDIRRIKAVTR